MIVFTWFRSWWFFQHFSCIDLTGFWLLITLSILGTLRRKVQQWLHRGSRGYSSNFSDCGISKHLVGFPAIFIKHEVELDVYISFDDEDLDAWFAEAQRWVRLLFLMVTGDQDLEPLCQVCVFVLFPLLAMPRPRFAAFAIGHKPRLSKPLFQALTHSVAWLPEYEKYPGCVGLFFHHCR